MPRREMFLCYCIVLKGFVLSSQWEVDSLQIVPGRRVFSITQTVRCKSKKWLCLTQYPNLKQSFCADPREIEDLS